MQSVGDIRNGLTTHREDINAYKMDAGTGFIQHEKPRNRCPLTANGWGVSE